MAFDPNTAFDPESIVEDEATTTFDADSAFDPESIVMEDEEPTRVSNWDNTEGNLGKAAEAAGLEFQAATDTILSGVGGAIGLAATLANLPVSMLVAENPFSAAKAAGGDAFAKTGLGKFLSQPITSMVDNEADIKGTMVSEVFDELGKTIGKGGEAIGGGENAAMAGVALETVLTVLGGKALKKDLEYLDAKAKQAPKLTVDQLMDEYDNMKANEPKPQLVNQDELPFTNDIADSPNAPKSALPDNYYQPELKYQDELPLTNEAIPQSPEFSPLADNPMPNKQDELPFTQDTPEPAQPDLFEPQANESLMAKNQDPITSPRERYVFSPKVQNALELAGIKTGEDGLPLASDPERVIQELRARAKQDYLDLAERPIDKKSTEAIDRVADDLIQGEPLPEKMQKQDLESLSDEITRDEWMAEFLRRNPNRNKEAAEFAWQRLQPEKSVDVSLTEGINDFFKVGFGTFFTRLGNISEELLQKSQRFEKDLLQIPHEIYKKTDVVFNAIKDFPDNVKADLEKAMFAKDKDAIYKAFAYAGRPDLFKVFEENVLKTVDDLGKQASQVGLFKSLKDDYFLPRVVKDYKGLAKALGKEDELPAVEKALQEAAKKAYEKGQRFGETEKAKVLNKFIRGWPKPEGYKAAYRKERKLDAVPEELQQYYYPTQDALHMYIKNISDDIQTFKFLGRNVKRDAEGKVDMSASVGAHLEELKSKSKLTPEQFDELQKLYQARFIGGNRSPHASVQTFKNIASGTLLSGLSSTALQVAELIPLITMSQPQVINGLKGAIKTSIDLIKNKGQGRINAKDLGLVDHYMNTEIQRYTGKGFWKNAANKSAALADAALRINIFKDADIALKTFNLNTQLTGAEYQLKTPRGRRLFEDDWKGRFGDKTGQLMSELKAGKITPLTVEYAWSQLAKTQAISKGNWAVWSLQHPNARIFTTLKTFALNQMQMFQTEGIRKIQKGNTKEGVKSLVKVATALTLGGMAANDVRDFILGREVSKPTLEKAGLALLKAVGLQERTAQKIKEGKFSEAAYEYITPPLLLDNATSDAMTDLTGGVKDPDTGVPLGESSKRRYLDILPLGKEIRSRYMGGAEEYNQTKLDRESLSGL